MLATQSFALFFVLTGFVVMGLIAILKPNYIPGLFDVPALTASGNNEVRAVYGGFGLAMGIALLIAFESPELRAGICLTLALALFGMASGRVVSWAIDKQLARVPLLAIVGESACAAMLLHAG